MALIVGTVSVIGPSYMKSADCLCSADPLELVFRQVNTNLTTN